GNDTYLAWQVDVAGHDADLALAGGDDARAVRPDQAYAQFVALDLGIQHVEGSDTFGDAYDQLDTGVGGFQDGILAERSRNVDHGGISTSSFHCFAHSVEYRQAQVRSATLARGNTTDHLSTVGNGLFGVEGALRAGDALADYLGVLVD